MKKIFKNLPIVCFMLTSAVLADELQVTGPLGVSQAPLAIQGDVVLTQAEIDAAFSKIPEGLRLPFIRNGEKVEALVRNLLRTKVLADEARKAGYDKDALQAIRIQLAGESELATDWLNKVISEAPDVDFEVIALENYTLNPGAWQSPEMIDVSHILISSETRSNKAAEEIAQDLWEQLEADPSLFDSMVAEYSDDPSKVKNFGRFPQVKREEMVKSFEEAAFAMKTPGQISEPVETEYGFHIIRLNEYIPPAPLPFEDVKEQAIAQARKEYLDEYRTRYLKQVLDNPIVLPDGAAEEMAKRYFGENLELAPVMEE